MGTKTYHSFIDESNKEPSLARTQHHSTMNAAINSVMREFRRHSFSCFFFHIINVFKLSFRLLGHLLVGTQTWVVMFGRLIAFTMVLMSGFLKLVYYWNFSPRIVRK